MEEKNVDKILEELTTVEKKPAVDITPAEINLPKPKRSMLLLILAILAAAVYAVITYFDGTIIVGAFTSTGTSGEQLGLALGFALTWAIVWIISIPGLALSLAGLTISAIRLKKGIGLKSELIINIIYIVYPLVLQLITYLIFKSVS